MWQEKDGEGLVLSCQFAGIRSILFGRGVIPFYLRLIYCPDGSGLISRWYRFELSSAASAFPVVAAGLASE